jgi:hypothetical protein
MSEPNYMAPNTMVPLQNRETGTLAGIAMEQLRSYQTRALAWKTWPDGRVRRCMECDESIYFTADPHGVAYQYTDDELLALTVAHIRQCHDEDGSNDGRRTD